MLSSTDSVVVFKTVFVPSTVRSPTRKCSILPVEPLILNASVVTPPSFTVKIISLFDVVCAIVKSSLDRRIVTSDPAPMVNPVSFRTPNVPDVVSLAFDLR